MKTFLYTFLFFSLCLLGTTTLAQWSSDPNVNLAIADTSGSQELPKIASTSDGGCYVSWFDNRGGGYKVFMQRLNAQGVKQWAPQGLLISANPQSSSLVDWDLAVDDSDNAIVVFTDTRNGSVINPFAYKITSQGTFAWGANGVQLSDSFSVFQPNPKVVKASDGNFVFTWIFSSTPRKVALQKLNAAGVKQWGAGPIFLSGTGTENLDYPLLVASDNGGVILQNSGYNGSAVSPSNYRIYARKLSAAGAPAWGANPDTVYGQFRVAGFFVPKIFSDGNNGAFCLWQDERGGANSTSYVQHITSAGTKLFPIDGTASSTLAGRLHNDAWISYTPATGETYMFWYETNSSTQSVYGVYGQKFSANGTRQWPDSGVAFKALAPATQPSFIRTFAKDSAAVVYYLEISSGQNRVVKGFKTNRSGNLLWGGTIKDVSSVISSKGRLTGAFTSTGISLLVWADSRLDANGIYGQNVNFDGTLGNAPTPGWTIRVTGPPAFPHSVKQVNANVIWIGGNGAVVRRSTDGGATWMNGNPNPGVITGDIYNIDALDANTALCTTSPAATYLYRTTNGGVGWTQVFTQAGGFINAIAMTDASNGIAIGDPVGGITFTIVRTTNGGATWTREPPANEPIPVGGEFGLNNSLSVVGTTHIWFGTSVGAVWRSTSGGVGWTRTTTTSSGSAAAVHFNNTSYGVAGESRSIDGGATWVATSIPGTGSVSGLSGVGSDFFASKGTNVYRSTDRGATWAVSFTGTIGTLSHLDFYGSGGNLYGITVSQTGGIATAFFVATGVRAETQELPTVFSLSQNYPNPFNPTTKLSFAIGHSSSVSLKVFDILGRVVATLVNENLSAGNYSVNFDAKALSSGVYFYRMQAGNFVNTKRMLLLK